MVEGAPFTVAPIGAPRRPEDRDTNLRVVELIGDPDGRCRADRAVVDLVIRRGTDRHEPQRGPRQNVEEVAPRGARHHARIAERGSGGESVARGRLQNRGAERGHTIDGVGDLGRAAAIKAVLVQRQRHRRRCRRNDRAQIGAHFDARRNQCTGAVTARGRLSEDQVARPIRGDQPARRIRDKLDHIRVEVGRWRECHGQLRVGRTKCGRRAEVEATHGRGPGRVGGGIGAADRGVARLGAVQHHEPVDGAAFHAAITPGIGVPRRVLTVTLGRPDPPRVVPTVPSMVVTSRASRTNSLVDPPTPPEANSCGSTGSNGENSLVAPPMPPPARRRAAERGAREDHARQRGEGTTAPGRGHRRRRDRAAGERHFGRKVHAGEHFKGARILLVAEDEPRQQRVEFTRHGTFVNSAGFGQTPMIALVPGLRVCAGETVHSSSRGTCRAAS